MWTRLIRLTLMLALLTLALAACGSEPAESPVEAATTGPTPTPVPAAPTPESPPPISESPIATPEPQARTFSIVPEASSASYSVEEEFFGAGFNTAVGTTRDISGEFSVVVDEAHMPITAEGEIMVDLRTLTSDESERDQRIRENELESNKYPFAVFELTRIEEFPDSWTVGQSATFKLVGDMTIREVTRELTFDVTATFDGETLRGTATTYLRMFDFGFKPPSVIGIMRVTDGVTVTVEFTAREIEG